MATHAATLEQLQASFNRAQTTGKHAEGVAAHLPLGKPLANNTEQVVQEILVLLRSKPDEGNPAALEATQERNLNNGPVIGGGVIRTGKGNGDAAAVLLHDLGQVFPAGTVVDCVDGVVAPLAVESFFDFVDDVALLILDDVGGYFQALNVVGAFLADGDDLGEAAHFGELQSEGSDGQGSSVNDERGVDRAGVACGWERDSKTAV